jgi:hypothetical protein
MSTSSDPELGTRVASVAGIGVDEPVADSQLLRWGGGAGLAGGIALLASFGVVTALGLPDASDVETLTDFADIKSGRIAEHFLYLGALMLFALHVFVLHRLLRPAHQAAALFGTVFASFGLVMMAASSMLHLSTAPLADLYTDPGASSEDRRAIEYAWHGAQSVFDTMLATGALLVPIGMVLFGLAMRHTTAFGPRLTWFAIGLGLVGTAGAVVGIVDPGSLFLALGVLAIVVFHLAVGWQTLRSGGSGTIDLTDERRSGS